MSPADTADIAMSSLPIFARLWWAVLLWGWHFGRCFRIWSLMSYVAFYVVIPGVVWFMILFYIVLYGFICVVSVVVVHCFMHEWHCHIFDPPSADLERRAEMRTFSSLTTCFAPLGNWGNNKTGPRDLIVGWQVWQREICWNASEMNTKNSPKAVRFQPSLENKQRHSKVAVMTLQTLRLRWAHWRLRLDSWG